MCLAHLRGREHGFDSSAREAEGLGILLVDRQHVRVLEQSDQPGLEGVKVRLGVGVRVKMRSRITGNVGGERG